MEGGPGGEEKDLTGAGYERSKRSGEDEETNPGLFVKIFEYASFVRDSRTMELLAETGLISTKGNASSIRRRVLWALKPDELEMRERGSEVAVGNAA